MTVEEILRRAGDFGPAQWFLLSLFSLVNVFSAFHYFAQTFITLSPGGLCDDVDNLYGNHTGGSQLADGFDAFGDSRATFWGLDTLTKELNWTCQEAWKSAVVQSTFYMGSVAGTFTLGILADTFGRIPMLVTANIFAVLGNLLTVYLNPNIWTLSISRFVAGVATDTNFFMMYIIVMEYIKPGLRTMGLNLCIGIWYCIGCLLTPWLAIYAGNWRTFLLSISIPTMIVPLFCFFVPESAQWLLSVGRIDKAVECFAKLAKLNHKTICQDFIQRFKILEHNTKTLKGNLWDLFKTPCLRRKTCILIFKTVVLTLSYDAMSRNVEGLQLDPFAVFTITSASIFPSCVVILLLQDRIGRKAMAVFSLLSTAIFNFTQGAFIQFIKEPAYLGPVIGLLGRFSVNIAYNSGTQYAAELIPTQVRGQGLAAMHVVGYGAAFFSPHILYLAHIWIGAPECILGVLSFLGAVFCLFLPETLNKSLPSTLKDGEIFGEDEKVWDFLKRKKEK